MDVTTLVIFALSFVVIALIVAWGMLNSKAAAGRRELEESRKTIAEREEQLARKSEDLIRAQAEVRTAEHLRISEREQHEKTLVSEREQHEKALAEIKESHAKALDAAKTALALENDKLLKAREESLRKEAEQTMKNIAGGLEKNIKEMKESFEAQKKSHTEESASIKTQFAETVRHLREQTESIGNRAEDLAKALKGKNKIQGNFGETILQNMLKDQGLREGHDYETEYWLRDRAGNIIRNPETDKKMRPDFVLHFPDNTDILIDSKMSLTALTDYYSAETDGQREDALVRNLDSVKNHVKELTSKEYQKYVVDRKTLDYVIMFIPNYGAWQLAKAKDPDIFTWAFEHNVLITTEETLVPFLRLIRTAWVQKEQMENIAEIVKAAEDMVERVGLFCSENAKLEKSLEGVLDDFKKNTDRLVNGRQSIVKAARRAIDHGVSAPTGKNALPTPRPDLLADGE